MNQIKELLIVLILAGLAFRAVGVDFAPADHHTLGNFKTDQLTVTTSSSLAAATASTLNATGATDLDTTLNVDGAVTMQGNLSVPNGVTALYRTSQSTTRFNSNVGKVLAAGSQNDVDFGAGMSGANRLNFTSNAAGSTMTGMFPYVGAGELYVCTNTGGTLTITDDDPLSSVGSRYQLGTATVVFLDGDSWLQWNDGVYWHIAGVH